MMQNILAVAASSAILLAFSPVATSQTTGFPNTSGFVACIGERASGCHQPFTNFFDCSFAHSHPTDTDKAAAEQISKSNASNATAAQVVAGTALVSFKRLSSRSGDKCGYIIDQVIPKGFIVCVGQSWAGCSARAGSLTYTQFLDCSFAAAHATGTDRAAAQQIANQITGNKTGVPLYKRISNLSGDKCGYLFVQAYMQP